MLLFEDTQADPVSYLCRDEFMTAATLLSCCLQGAPASETSPSSLRTRGFSQQEIRGDSLVVTLTGAWRFDLNV